MSEIMARPDGTGSRPSDQAPTGLDRSGFDPSRGPAIARQITYFGQQAVVICDARCGKAWGINRRPRIALSDDPDNYAFLADDELGEAPADPGTYEGSDGKPIDPSERLNRWCIRECERSALSKPGKSAEPLQARDLSRRLFNQPWTNEARLASGSESA